MTGYEMVREIDSPDGSYKAVAFITNSGATTSFSTHVTLLKKDEKFKNEGGNVFRGYRSNFIDISWENDNKLKVIYKCSDEYIFLQEKEKYGANIEYIRLSEHEG